MKPKVYLSIFEYACERRELDAKRILDFFEINNYPIVKHPKQADIILYISCGIIEKNTKSSLEAIQKLKKYNARLIIGGCATEIDPDRVQSVHNGECFSTKNLDALDDLFPNEEYPFSSIKDANYRHTILSKNIWNGTVLQLINAIPGLGRILKAIVKFNITRMFGEYSFAYIKAVGLEKDYYIRIADGCASRCSYCALPAAIGRLKSKNASICLNEFRQGLEKGFKNITITAEDTGVWGIDLENSKTENIASLLEQMILLGGQYPDNKYSIILSSLNPASLNRHLNSLTKVFQNPVMACVVIPVQSLVPRLLALMNRFSDIDAIKKSLVSLRKASGKLWISTHILIGFPSETESEMLETLSLWEELPFDEGQFFAFSLKPGTPAEHIEGRLSEEEIQCRMKTAYKYFKKRGYSCFFHKYDFLFVSKKGMQK